MILNKILLLINNCKRLQVKMILIITNKSNDSQIITNKSNDYK